MAETGFDTWDLSEATPPVEQISEQPVEDPPTIPEVPEWDPSLRGGGWDELIPVFPNSHPLAAAQAQAPEASQRVTAEVPQLAADEAAEAAALALLGAASEPAGHQGGTSSLGMIRELQAELHLWGHAQPGQPADWFGHPLTPGPDGSFNLTLPVDANNPLLSLLTDGCVRKTPPS